MLHINLFGKPNLILNNQSVVIRRRKGLALIIYLAVMGAAQERQTLATLLWSESEQSKALATLRTTLGDLRRTPLEPHIIIKGNTIALQNITVDVTRFRKIAQQCLPIQAATLSLECAKSLKQAVSLYTDDFLAGYSLPKSEAFYDWYRLMQRQLYDLLGEIFHALVLDAMKQEQDSAAIQWARRQITHDPLLEEAHQTLMRLYIKTKQRSAALEQYRRCADYLKSELNVEPQAETKQLYDAIRDNEVLDVSVIRPIAVPPPLQTVIGRNGLIRQIVNRLEAQSRILVLQGGAGIGKTTTARTLAHHSAIKSHFPDGVLWASLGGNPNVISELLMWASILDTAVTPDTPVEHISRRLAVKLQHKRMLIILDDVWDETHLPLLMIGGQQCVHLMTTRQYNIAHRLVATPQDVILVTPLTQSGSIALFKQLAPHIFDKDDKAVQDLLQTLNGLPIAIHVAARLLNQESHMTWGIETLMSEIKRGDAIFTAKAPIDRLSTGNIPQSTVAALLEQSIQRLDNDIQQQFLKLSVFASAPATIDLRAMEAIWGVDDAKPTIRILVNHGLIEPVRSGQFQIHALLNAYSRSKLTDDVSLHRAIKRHAQHYFHTLAEADTLYQQDRLRITDALQMVDAVMSQIRQAQQQLLDNATDMTPILCQVVPIAADLLKLRQTPKELMHWYEGGYQAAISGNKPLSQGNLLYQMARSAIQFGDYDKADNALKRALSLANELDDTHLMARVWHSMGRMAFVQSDYIAAEQAFSNSHSLWQQVNDEYGLAQSQNHLGNVAWRRGNYTTALSHYEASLTIWKRLGDKWGIAQCLSSLGNVAGVLRRDEIAQNYHEQSLALRRELNDQLGTGEALNSLGVVYWRQGQYDIAHQYFADGLAMREELGDQQGIIIGHVNLGRVTAAQSNFVDAERYYQRALTISRDSKMPHWIAYSLTKLSKSHIQQGQLFTAYQFLVDALTISLHIDSMALQLEVLSGFSWLYLYLAEYERAYRMMRFLEGHIASYDDTQDDVATLHTQLTQVLSAEQLTQLANQSSVNMATCIAWIDELDIDNLLDSSM